MSHAEKCIVCHGCGKYEGKGCHGCSGKGWVTVVDRLVIPVIPYMPPNHPMIRYSQGELVYTWGTGTGE